MSTANLVTSSSPSFSLAVPSKGGKTARGGKKQNPKVDNRPGSQQKSRPPSMPSTARGEKEPEGQIAEEKVPDTLVSVCLTMGDESLAPFVFLEWIDNDTLQSFPCELLDAPSRAFPRNTAGCSILD